MRCKRTSPGILGRWRWRGSCRRSWTRRFSGLTPHASSSTAIARPDASSLIVTESEGRPVPANRVLSEHERSRRLDHIHAPYPRCNRRLPRRAAWPMDGQTALIAIHSFTPVYFGKARPWQVGILFDDDRRLADLLIGGLEGRPSPHRRHQPTLFPCRRGLLHARPPCPAARPSLSHDRNSQRRDQRRGGQRSWAERLADILFAATPGLFESSHAMV